MRGDFLGYAFIPLLDEPEVSQCLDLLTARQAPAAPVPVQCVRPPLGGLAFIATTGEVSDMLDSWWSHAVPEERLPVLIAVHQPGLEAWVREMDAEAVIGVSDDRELALYAGLQNVRAVLARDPVALADFVCWAYEDCFEPALRPPAEPPAAAPPPETPFRPRVPAGSSAPAPAPMPPPPPPQAPPRQFSSGAGWDGQGLSGPSEAPPPPPPAAVPPPQPQRAAPLDFRTLLERATSMLGAPRSGWVPEELTRLALSHPLGRIVSVSSRAGGVGKTAVAAALGIIYGEAAQASGWCAAVVDQNIGNPDQWGRLTLSADVPTVFEIMADIEAGREWSVPAWNRTPALAIYPERRDVTDAYAPAQIERFAAQLRQLHVMSVIDLPNRIPAFTSAEAAVCAGWVGVSDLLVIPTTDDPTRLQGVLDYLDAPMVRGDGQASSSRLRVIVPYLRSPLRAVRDDPGVRAMLDQIRTRVVAVVEVPRNERATLAIVRGQPITEVDAGLRSAFVELALAIARTLAQG